MTLGFINSNSIGGQKEKGHLIKTVQHDNWINDGEGCHSAVDDITEKEFYTNGQIKSIKYFKKVMMEVIPTLSVNGSFIIKK